ncbi:lipoprotein insertase outer membrane protein LolB [Shewanella psychrotolerans]|uniref:lipoprotein insertase outer membrane protein LolB n=1 Tax=Shewanella psychrotolerans TaxID=2864206 RepID=UPI001C65DD57|nr:lipoprotein insertase outer membrane protein LolB [Shewanella psychrotolerans]QYK00561.1 lipoprotein insertase outer membrane protein LolB [Shewanella psychrotolerans]
MNNLNYFTKIILTLPLLSSLLLGGCVSRPDINLIPVNVNSIERAKAWEMQGKLAIKTAEDKYSTNLYWLHTEYSNELRLTTMLGTTVMSLTSDTNGAKLELDGKTYRDDEPEQLLKRLTGWSIPIDTLPRWITGQISATDQVISRDEQHRPLTVQSHLGTTPWQVTFKSWQTQSGAPLPKLLELTREDIRLKIQINQWQALAESVAISPETPEKPNEQ